MILAGSDHFLAGKSTIRPEDLSAGPGDDTKLRHPETPLPLALRRAARYVARFINNQENVNREMEKTRRALETPPRWFNPVFALRRLGNPGLESILFTSTWIILQSVSGYSCDREEIGIGGFSPNDSRPSRAPHCASRISRISPRDETAFKNATTDRGCEFLRGATTRFEIS